MKAALIVVGLCQLAECNERLAYSCTSTARLGCVFDERSPDTYSRGLSPCLRSFAKFERFFIRFARVCCLLHFSR